jgi:hypothetical protein
VTKFGKVKLTFILEQVVKPQKGVMVSVYSFFNPLNAELNPICHLLILLGDLTFMCKFIVSISNKMQRYTVYLYLETALHVSGGMSVIYCVCRLMFS